MAKRLAQGGVRVPEEQMEEQEFGVQMEQVHEDMEAGRHEKALADMRDLERRLLAAATVADPRQLGWVRYYALKCLHTLKRWQEGYQLLVTPPPVPFIVSTRNAAWMHSVGAELARHLGRADEVVRLGSRCLHLRLQDRDLPGAVIACQTLCLLLKDLGCPDRETCFARFLLRMGVDHGAANPVAAALEAAMAIVARGTKPELLPWLQTLRPRIAELDTRDTWAAQKLPELTARLDEALARFATQSTAAATVTDADERARDFWQAANSGDMARVETLLAAGVDPNLCWPERPGLPTALFAAAFAGQTQIVRRLLEAGATVDAVNTQHRTALILAADQGHAPVVEVLLAAGAARDHAGIFGQTALHVAAWQNHWAALQALLQGSPTLAARDINGDTPLALAVTENVPEIVAALLDAGSDIEARNDFAQTPLCRAAMSGRTDMAELLLRRGADRQARDSVGRTSADWAEQEGHGKLAERLREPHGR